MLVLNLCKQLNPVENGCKECGMKDECWEIMDETGYIPMELLDFLEKEPFSSK